MHNFDDDSATQIETLNAKLKDLTSEDKVSETASQKVIKNKFAMKIKSEDASIGLSANSKKSVINQAKREITKNENKLKIITEEKVTVRAEIEKVFENSVERLVSTLNDSEC